MKECLESIYIPHWLDSKRRILYQRYPQGCIYIPHWLDSKLLPSDRCSNQISIYIPHWLDSKIEKRYSSPDDIIHLHSTLVRF